MFTFTGIRTQRQLGVLERSASGQRGLMLAAGALEDLAGVQVAVLVIVAGGAAEAVRSACLKQRLGGLLVGSVAVEEVPQALSLLEQDLVLRYL